MRVSGVLFEGAECVPGAIVGVIQIQVESKREAVDLVRRLTGS